MCNWRIRTILVSGHLQLRTPSEKVSRKMILEIKYVNANNAVIHTENSKLLLDLNCKLVTGILAKISLGTGIWAKFRLATGIWYPPSRPSLNNSKFVLKINTLNRHLGIRRFIAFKREKFAKAKQIASRLRLALVSGMKNNRIFKDTLNKRLQESSDRK